MTLQTRGPGAFHLKAQDYNFIVEAANGWHRSPKRPDLAAVPEPPTSRVWARAVADVDLFQPLHLREYVPASDGNLDITVRPTAYAVEADALSSSIKPHQLFLGVAQGAAKAGSLVPVLISGVTLIKYAGLDASKSWLDYDDQGALVAGDAGRWRILPYGGSNLGGCVVALPAAMPQPVAYNPYTIDRTAAGDDNKGWDPANNLPADWADYDAVELVTGSLRLTSGGVALVAVRRTWAATVAPVIPAVAAADVTDPTEVFECENAGE